MNFPAALRESWRAFAEAPDEKARMGQIAGLLWMAAAAIAAFGGVLPGAHHGPTGWVLAVCAIVFLYGLGCATRLIRWDRASIRAHAFGTAATFPMIALAVYLMGNARAYVEPLLVVPLLYSAFFFPRRLAWMLTFMLLATAGLPLLTDQAALDQAFPPRYVALCVGFIAAAWVIIGLRERLDAAERRQREMANTDPLTGVGNRRAFDQRIREELAARTGLGRRAVDQTPLALLVFDLDDFKGINDRLGHPVGDTVLREVARSVTALLRTDGTLARIGGDEFAVIAPRADSEQARQMADSILVGLAAAPDDDLHRPGVSVGWAVFPEDGRDYETLLRTADARMLGAKRQRQLERITPDADEALPPEL